MLKIILLEIPCVAWWLKQIIPFVSSVSVTPSFPRYLLFSHEYRFRREATSKTVQTETSSETTTLPDKSCVSRSQARTTVGDIRTMATRSRFSKDPALFLRVTLSILDRYVHTGLDDPASWIPCVNLSPSHAP